MTDLAINVERTEAATLVVLRGDLDLATSSDLRECLVCVPQRTSGPGSVQNDLSCCNPLEELI